MGAESLSKFTDQKLQREKRKIRVNEYIDAVFVGFTFGISVYSLIKNGFNFFTIFPLFLSYPIIRAS